ncbi:hypothetical protein AB0B79_30310 [Streptomyces sp. NPDC039022]|uniref:hypothetical protein n=1 Tax=Streptomyces sp. NPDC039022 TaxID=3157091 RepID=UPI0033F7FBEE
MRITVVNGERQVAIHIKGKGAKALARAEAAAARLLTVGPEPEERPAFGYAVTSDHEVAGEDT